jgi:hypothetical protein
MPRAMRAISIASRIALLAQAVGVDRLVRQREHVEQRVEMPDRGVDVRGLDRIAAPEMHGRQRVSQPDQVLVVDAVAGTAAALAIGGVGRAGDRAEGQRVAADLDRLARVAGMEPEAARRLAEEALDQRRVEAHAVGVRVDVGASILEQRLRLGVEDVHPDLFEDGQRRAMDRLELVRRHRRHRREGQPRLRRRRVRCGLRSGSRALAPSPSSACWCFRQA